MTQRAEPTAGRRPRRPAWLWPVVYVVLAVAIGGGVGVVARGSDLRPLRITSGSMSPAIERGDWIVARNLAAPAEARFRRGEIVLLRFPLGTGGRAVKRVIALPGDRVKIAERSVTVAGHETPIAGAPSVSARRERTETVPPGHVFLLGDNAAVSIDSRSFGPVPTSEIVARKVLVIGRLRPPLFAMLTLVALPGCGLLILAGRRARRRTRMPSRAPSDRGQVRFSLLPELRQPASRGCRPILGW